MNFDDKTVYILDSYGLIFRCYFAFISRPLTNPNGDNVSALFGFFRNLHWILEHYKPGYLVAAMDSKTKTFRHEMYPEYKATRNKTPDDLHAQIPWISEVLEKLGVPVLQCDGYEADDIIATVAKKCAEQGRTCRILSGDKDLMQLVTQSCQILKPESGASTWKVTGPEGVEAEWGVPPEKLLDLLSLYGDTADNVPGVHGVGVKTAAKLLTDYENLDGIYEHVGEIKGAMQQKLIDGKDDAYFSQKLIKLCDTVPCEDIEKAINCEKYKYNYEGAAILLEKYGVPNVAKSYENLELTLNAGSNAKTHAKENNLINTSGNASAGGGNASAGTGENASDKTENNATESTSSFDSAYDNYIEAVQNDTSGYTALKTEEELKNFIDGYLSKLSSAKDKSKLPIAYDSETTSFNTFEARILGFSLAYEKGKSVYVPLNQDNSDSLFGQSDYVPLDAAFKQLERIFYNKDVHVYMHNAKYDLKVLSNNGFNIEKIFTDCNLLDTMLLAWLYNPDRLGKKGYGLEYLCETQLGLKGIEFDEIVKKGQTFEDVPLETAVKYAAEDADFTLQLGNWFLEKEEWFTQNKKLIELEHQVLPVLINMELTGIHLDSSFLHTYNEELSRNLALVIQNIYKEVGHEFNIASPKQLQTVLFEERHLKPGKKTKTGYSTDTSVLEELAFLDPVPRMILEYRENAKLQSTYVETLPQMTDKNGRIHTDFVQTGTATGRLSCREPNLQNIPVRSEAGRKIRSAFTAPKGKVLISADYAQIELVVLAHLSGDKNMCKSFIEGTDVHKATAAMIYNVKPEDVTAEMRRTAKTINFGVIYGMSGFRLAQDLGISRTQANMFIENYFKMYKEVDEFINKTIHDAEKTGYIQTILGRRRPVLNINSRNKVEKSAAERIAVNSPVQGSAADIVKMAMLKIARALKDSNSNARLLLQVHDELIFECPDNKEEIEKTISLIKENMENAFALSVPLRVSIEYGKNWGEFH